MLMQIIVLALIAAIAYFHYVEGFFSSSISAIVAMFAALGAFSLHEQVAQLMVNQKILPDQAQAISLTVLFAAMYIVPRLAFDALVPGNVRVPVLVDKIGSPVLGLFVGAMAVGIMAIALQELPMGPVVGGYGRYGELPDRAVALIPPGFINTSTYTVFGEVAEPVLSSDWGVSPSRPVHHVWTPGDTDGGKWQTRVPSQNTLAISVDDMVVGLVSRTCQGALAGEQTLDMVHPDFLLELFAQRVGIESGQRHTTTNLGSSVEFAVPAVYFPTETIPVIDGFSDQMRTSMMGNDPPIPTLATTIKSGDDYKLIVIRTVISDPNNDQDADKIMRMSTASLRLCMPMAADGTMRADLYPEGTLVHAGGNLLLWNKPSDPLFLDFSTGNTKLKTIDWVYMVPSDAIHDNKFPPGTFLEFKRNARVDLDERVKTGTSIESAEDSLLRDSWTLDDLKKAHAKPAAPAVSTGGTTPGAAPPPAGNQTPATPQPVPDINRRVAPALTGQNGL
jgi:hypothetical protein